MSRVTSVRAIKVPIGLSRKIANSLLIKVECKNPPITCLLCLGFTTVLSGIVN